MFIYEFKSEITSLITKVVISGNHITLYTNKNNAQELNTLKDFLKLEHAFFSEHPSHNFCHNPFVDFSARGDGVPHKHIRFPPDGNRAVHLKNIVNHLLDRQKNPLLRKQDYDNFINGLDEERRSHNDTCFPKYVQDAIDTYDLQTPFVPEHEINGLVNAFDQYANNAFHHNVEAIEYHAEEFIKTHWDTVYTKNIIGFGDEELDTEEVQICEYYKGLKDLRELMLAKESDPNNINLYYYTRDVIKKIMANKNFNEHSSFSNSVTYLREQIEERLHRMKTCQCLNLIMITAAFSVGAIYFFTQERDPYRILATAATTTASAVGISHYAAGPLAKAAKQIFFKAKEKIYAQQNNVTPSRTYGVARPARIR